MRILLAVLALGGLFGCEEDEPVVTGTGPLVTYAKSGGFAPQPHTLTIGRDGRARLTVVSTPREEAGRRFRLSGPQLDEIEAALDAARGVEAPTAPTGCADCFEYDVHADGVDFHLDDANLQDAPAELTRLVAALERLSR